MVTGYYHAGKNGEYSFCGGCDMYISGTLTLGAEKVERTIAAVEILTGVRQETISDDELLAATINILE